MTLPGIKKSHKYMEQHEVKDEKLRKHNCKKSFDDVAKALDKSTKFPILVELKMNLSCEQKMESWLDDHDMTIKSEWSNFMDYRYLRYVIKPKPE